LMDLFEGSGYPTYAFLDKKGRYIKNGISPRMNQTNIENLKILIEGK
jgi:hypothetical protein